MSAVNQRPVFRSCDKYWPIRGHYSGRMTSIDQSEAIIQVTWLVLTNQRSVFWSLRRRMKLVLLSPCLLSRVHSWYKTQLQGPELRSVFPHSILDRNEMQAPLLDNSTQCHNPNSRYQSDNNILELWHPTSFVKSQDTILMILLIFILLWYQRQ